MIITTNTNEHIFSWLLKYPFPWFDHQIMLGLSPQIEFNLFILYPWIDQELSMRQLESCSLYDNFMTVKDG